MLATDIDALAKKAIDFSLTPEQTAASATDEPLEDLIDANTDTYASAAVGQDGVYRLKKLAAGRYFVVWIPADTDRAHLPGGSACRSARDRTSLAGAQLDLRVSGRPSDSATYVGSTGCLACHGRNRSMRTTHRLSLQPPGLRGAFQDATQWPAIDQGVDAFDQPTTLYYYDCDPDEAGEVKCSVSSTDPTIATPGAVVSFELVLARNTGVARGEVGAYTLRDRQSRRNGRRELSRGPHLRRHAVQTALFDPTRKQRRKLRLFRAAFAAQRERR